LAKGQKLILTISEDELAEIDAAVDRDGAASRSRFVVEAALARARERMPLRQAVDAVTRVLDEPVDALAAARDTERECATADIPDDLR
jgi:uncharacterized protein (DUF1778 family)